MGSNVYEIVTARILKELENGTAPWRQPWHTMAPANMASKKPYRGVNVWLLGMMHRTSPYWGTLDQAKAIGGSVKRGEKASLVVFYRRYERDARPGDGGTIRETTDGRLVKETWLLRYYNVFNVDQMDLPDKVRATLGPTTVTTPPLESAEAIIKEIPNAPALRFGGGLADPGESRSCVSGLDAGHGGLGAALAGVFSSQSSCSDVWSPH